MTVNLTRIYTKLGDGGETHLGDMSRVSKLHPRVEASGTVDELNATIGVALLEPLPEIFERWLRRIQNDLLDVGADLSVPPGAEGTRNRMGRVGYCAVASQGITPAPHAVSARTTNRTIPVIASPPLATPPSGRMIRARAPPND